MTSTERLWTKRLGVLGFAFFLVKGLLWLALMGRMASLGGRWL